MLVQLWTQIMKYHQTLTQTYLKGGQTVYLQQNLLTKCCLLNINISLTILWTKCDRIAHSSENNPWKWAEIKRLRIESISKALRYEFTLLHIDPAVLVHRRPNGIEQLLAFASRSMAQAEIRCSSIDNEALVIILSILQLNVYFDGIDYELPWDYQS